jgi:hypothetical protein
VNERADGDGQFQVGAVVTGAVRSLAVLTAFGVEDRMKSIADESVGVRAGDDNDRPAVAAVAPARPAARDALLAAECQASASTAASRDVNVDFVDENVALLQRLDADDPSVRAVILEPNTSRNLGEDGVVFPSSGVQARTEAAAALPDDDRAAGDDVAIVRLDAEPLGI